jgi:hypothetical protein
LEEIVHASIQLLRNVASTLVFALNIILVPSTLEPKLLNTGKNKRSSTKCLEPEVIPQKIVINVK